MIHCKPYNIFVYLLQSRILLERHLKIGQSLDVAQLLNHTQHHGGVQMLRGSAKLEFSHEKGPNGGKILYTALCISMLKNI